MTLISEYTNPPAGGEEKAMYDSSMKYKWDNKNVRDYEVAEAKKEQAREIAVKLKKEGLSIEFIAETTGLTAEAIEKLCFMPDSKMEYKPDDKKYA